MSKKINQNPILKNTIEVVEEYNIEPLPDKTPIISNKPEEKYSDFWKKNIDTEAMIKKALNKRDISSQDLLSILIDCTYPNDLIMKNNLNKEAKAYEIFTYIMDETGRLFCRIINNVKRSEKTFNFLFIAAVGNNSLKIVDYMLNKKKILKLNVDSRSNNKDDTALLFTCQRGYVDMAKLLLQHNADPTLKNTAGESALSVAQKSENKALSDLFSKYQEKPVEIKKKKKKRNTSTNIKKLDNDNNDKKMEITSTTVIVETERKSFNPDDTAEEIAKFLADFLKIKEKLSESQLETILNFSVDKKKAILKILLDKQEENKHCIETLLSVEFISAKIIFAEIDEDNTDILSRLLNAGMSIDYYFTERQATMLFYATLKNKEKIVAFLLERKANPNLADISGVAPLHIAAALGFINLLELLINHQATLNSPTKEEAYTPLMAAIQTKQLMAIQFLIKSDAGRSAIEHKNMALFEMAIASDDLNIMEYVVELDLKSALNVLASKNCFDEKFALAVLRAAEKTQEGTSIVEEYLNQEKYSDLLLKTIISLLNISEFPKLVSSLIKHAEFQLLLSEKLYRQAGTYFENLLIQPKCSILSYIDKLVIAYPFLLSKKINKEEDTFLFKIIAENPTKPLAEPVLQWLKKLWEEQKLEFKQNSNGDTFLHLVFFFLDDDQLNLFLSKENIDDYLKMQNAAGVNSLHLAACRGYTKIFKSTTLDLKIRDHQGYTCLHYAVINNQYAIVFEIIARRSLKDEIISEGLNLAQKLVPNNTFIINLLHDTLETLNSNETNKIKLPITKSIENQLKLLLSNEWRNKQNPAASIEKTTSNTYFKNQTNKNQLKNN